MVEHRISVGGRIVSVIGCVLAVVVGLSSAWAADYPQKGKSIQMLVGNAAGGPTDLGARIMAAGLEKELGVPVVVVNKPGANGQIQLTQVASAKPDGYTFGTVNFPVTITGYLDPTRKATYNRKSFEPLAMHVNDPNIFAVLTKSPYKTVKDLVEAAKAKPKTITVSSGMRNDEQIGIVQLAETDRRRVRAGKLHPGDGAFGGRPPGGQDRCPLRSCGGRARACQERGCPGPGGHG